MMSSAAVRSQSSDVPAKPTSVATIAMSSDERRCASAIGLRHGGGCGLDRDEREAFLPGVLHELAVDLGVPEHGIARAVLAVGQARAKVGEGLHLVRPQIGV